MFKRKQANILQSLFLLMLLPLLSTCSSYKIVYDYTPPKTKQGLSCIQNSQSQLNQCNNRCYYKYQSCLKKSQNEAQRALPHLLREYPSQLEVWLNAKEQHQRDLNWYELRMDLLEARRENYLNSCQKKGKKKSKCLNSHGYTSIGMHFDRPSFTMPRPVKPTVSSITARYRKESCSQDCGCQPNYRQSYASCGGVVKSRKVCIKNCN
ncbi:MAG: hypothetical protein V3V19_03970 [Cocleimonas sp.]